MKEQNDEKRDEIIENSINNRIFNCLQLSEYSFTAKDNMMTYIKLTLSLYVLVIALCGCTNTDQQLLEEGSPATTKLTVNLPATKATADLPANESVVHRARVIVVASEGTTREGKVTGNMLFDNLQGLKLEVLALSGISDIYVLANETPEQTGALDKIASLQQLKNALVSFKPLPVGTSVYDDLPMMALISNVTIDLDSKKNIFSATLKRLWAKFNICFKAEGEYIDQVQLTSIELQSLPKYSYWLDGHAYPETNFTKGTKTDLNGSEGLLISATPTQSFVFYAPEYLVTDPDAHTRLIVRGYKKDVPSTLCVYRVALGHNPSPESEDETVDYNIRRNTRYNMTGVIKGYGGGDVDVEMTVNKWHDTVEMGEETGKYFYLPKTKGDDIAWNTTSFTIEVKGNVEWKAQVIKGKGVSVVSSGTGSKITVDTQRHCQNYNNDIEIRVYTESTSIKKKEFRYTIQQSYPLITIGRIQIAPNFLTNERDEIKPMPWTLAKGFESIPPNVAPPTGMGPVRTGCNTMPSSLSGWRLPTVSELTTIHNSESVIAGMGGAPCSIPGAPWTVWSSQPLYPRLPFKSSMIQCISSGNISTHSPLTDGLVRCVRDI